MARPPRPTILPAHASWPLVRLEADEQLILAGVATTASEALCPLCQCRCESIHSHSVRLVADLPWAGWAVRLQRPVRRFFCQKKAWLRHIFTERLPNVVAPSARRPLRLTDLFLLIGFADGEGKPASAWSMGWGEKPVLTRSCGSFANRKRARCPPLGCWAWMTVVSAGAGALGRSSSTSNAGVRSPCFPIAKLRRSKSGCVLTLGWKASAGIAVAPVPRVPGKERHKLSLLRTGGIGERPCVHRGRASCSNRAILAQIPGPQAIGGRV